MINTIPTIANAEILQYKKQYDLNSPFTKFIRQHYEYYNTKIKTYPSGQRVIINAPFRLKHELTAEANADINRDIKINSYAYWNNLEYQYYEPQADKTLLFTNKAQLDNKYKKDSSKRSKDAIMDIARSNEFNLFGTFTTSPKQMKNRKDYQEFTEVINTFLKAFKRRHPDAIYLLIPEQHKNKAWHAHILLKANILAELTDSNIKDNSGRTIYNWDKYAIGFTTFTIIDSSSKASSYVAKYVSKLNEVPKSKKRYWASKNIKKPTLQYDNVDEQTLSEMLQNASHSSETTRTIRNYLTGEQNPVTYRYMTFNPMNI